MSKGSLAHLLHEFILVAAAAPKSGETASVYTEGGEWTNQDEEIQGEMVTYLHLSSLALGAAMAGLFMQAP